MPFELKMPQLGMNQDSAIIVDWLKAVGDKVAIGDPVLEVETDKATVEVECIADGFLTGIRASAGADVPVGDVVAVIVETAAEVADYAGPDPEAKAATTEAVEVAAETPVKPPSPDAPAPEPVPEPVTNPVVLPGPRVLASPKAKRLASERGIDLAALRARGVSEPIHARDLSQVTAGGSSVMTAKASAVALDALLDRSEGADRTALLATFCVGGIRSVSEADDIAIVQNRIDPSTIVITPRSDRGTEDTSTVPTLTIIDLCDTRLTGFAPAAGGLNLAIARDDSAFSLTFSFDESALPVSTAIALLDTIAARVEDPIRQLL